MAHEEYRRIVPGAKTAVLFIHGIVGSPNHFLSRIPLVQKVPETWSVYNLLLPGHGAEMEDFAQSSSGKWKNHVWGAFRELSQNHEQVIVVGHSMGTLFSIQLAVDFPDKIPFLFLIAVPMIPYVWPQFALTCLRLVFGKIRPDHPQEVAFTEATGTKTTRKLWKYATWIPRFWELFREIAVTAKLLPKLDVPTFAWQSNKDELVTRSSRKVLQRNDSIEIHELDNSTHFYYAPDERSRLLDEFRDLCDRYGKKQD